MHHIMEHILPHKGYKYFNAILHSSYHLVSLTDYFFQPNMQHRQVCLFPSKHFYDGSLVSAPVTSTEYLKYCSRYQKMEKFWPVSKDKPIVFYSVQGKESSLSSDEKVRLQSICNQQEARKIVSLHKLFSDVVTLATECMWLLHVHAHT